MRTGAFVLLAVSVVACAHDDARRPAGYAPPAQAAPPPGQWAYAPSPYPPPPANLPPPWQTGLATWYGGSFAGKPTSNGEPYDPRGMTAAHRTLPFNTWVEVRRPDTGASVVVRIDDRGPWGHAKRVIDVSQGAAARLGMIPLGPTPVEIRIVRPPS